MSGEKAREESRDAGTIDSGALAVKPRPPQACQTHLHHLYTPQRRARPYEACMPPKGSHQPLTSLPASAAAERARVFQRGEVVGPCFITKALPPLSFFLQSKTAQEVAVFGYKHLAGFWLARSCARKTAFPRTT